VQRRCFKAPPSRPTTSISSTGERRRTSGRGQINLSTSLGPIDPLCELDAGQGYDELLAHSQFMSDGERVLRVLDLPTLIAVKTKAGRPKDRVVLPILIATLQERNKAKQ